MEKIDNKAVKLGYLIRVKNTNIKKFENDIYVALQIEDNDGSNERCILFTELDVADMEKVSCDWLLETLKPGRLYPIIIGNRKTNLIKIFNYSNEEKIFRISTTQLKKAEARAARNKEDLTKKSFLTDVFD